MCYQTDLQPITEQMSCSKLDVCIHVSLKAVYLELTLIVYRARTQPIRDVVYHHERIHFSSVMWGLHVFILQSHLETRVP